MRRNASLTPHVHPRLARQTAASRQMGVRAHALQRLAALHYPQLRRVTCDFHEGVLTLRGVVDSFHLKQVAQAALAGLEGAEEIANRLEVRYPR